MVISSSLEVDVECRQQQGVVVAKCRSTLLQILLTRLMLQSLLLQCLLFVTLTSCCFAFLPSTKDDLVYDPQKSVSFTKLDAGGGSEKYSVLRVVDQNELSNNSGEDSPPTAEIIALDPREARVARVSYDVRVKVVLELVLDEQDCTARD